MTTAVGARSQLRTFTASSGSRLSCTQCVCVVLAELGGPLQAARVVLGPRLPEIKKSVATCVEHSRLHTCGPCCNTCVALEQSMWGCSLSMASGSSYTWMYNLCGALLCGTLRLTENWGGQDSRCMLTEFAASRGFAVWPGVAHSCSMLQHGPRARLNATYR